MDDMELDFFENDGMESDFVLDTPDRLDRMRQGTRVNRDHTSSLLLGSPGSSRQHWHGNSRLAHEVAPSNTRNCDYAVRRARLVSPTADSVDNIPQPHSSRRKSENFISSPGHPSCQTFVSESKHGDVNAVDPAVPSGVSCPKMHSNDKRKLERDIHGKNRYDSFMEVIDILDSPEPQTIRKSIKDATPNLPQNNGDVDRTDAAIKHLNLGPDLKYKRQQSSFRPLKVENCANTATHRMLVENEFSSHSEEANCSTTNDKKISAVGGDSHKNSGEITDNGSNSAAQNEMLNRDALSRKNGHRKLVRNGCIAPSNIAKGKSTMDLKKDRKGKVVEDSHASAHTYIAETDQKMEPNNERYISNKMKGKEISCGNDHINGRNLRLESSPRRLLTEDDSSDGHPDISCFVEESGWRTTRNRKGAVDLRKKPLFSDMPVQIHEGSVGDSEHANKINVNSDADLLGMMRSSSLEPSTSKATQMRTTKAPSHGRGLDKSPTILKGKRKNRSARNHHGEYSSDHLESVSFSSFGQSSSTLPARSCNPQRSGTWNESVIDVDGLYSPVRCRSPQRITSAADDSHARTLQVESDEQLARQLQEQLFNEEPVFAGSEEIDASIAWTMQQEEDYQNTRMVQSRHHSRTSGESATHLYRQYARNSLSNTSGRIPSHARASARINNLRRSLNRRNMDLDSRIDFLEALEAAFDARIEERVSHRTNPLLHVQRDFTEADYEMLLALDNDNDRHCGASLHQINSLPLSNVQSENGETCAVCLENHKVGETIRHMPCFHKFHKDCIDPWLRRKTWCPVCKCGIT